MKYTIVAAFTFLSVICAIKIVAAESYVGIILDGYQKDCIVQSRNAEYDCREGLPLYEGDKIIKRPDIGELKIKWAPYASGKKIDSTMMEVVFNPPKDKKGIVQSLREILGLVKTKYLITTAASRGDSGKNGVAQPGNTATVIAGQKIRFTWDDDDVKFIVFQDSKGREVFKKYVKGESSVQLTPEEIGMIPSESYIWHVSGQRDDKQSKIRLLSSDITKLVTDDLKEIENEGISDTEKLIKKAAYLQFMSDSYPKDIDLYWLSYKFLEGIGEKTTLKEDNTAVLNELRKKYLRHVREAMRD